MILKPYYFRVVKQVYKNVTAGYISLITSAPPSVHPGNVAANCKSTWLAKYLSAVPPSPTRARALSLLELAQAQASIETNDQYLLGEISKDMIAMQQQPVIMRQYRRFVIIMGDSEAEEVGEQWQGKDGVSLTPFEDPERMWLTTTYGLGRVDHSFSIRLCGWIF